MLSQIFKLSKYVPKILGKGNLALLFAFGLLIFALWSNVAAYAQNGTAPVNGTSPSSSQQNISKVKITSPTRGQQVS
jgi:hypothetical protein